MIHLAATKTRVLDARFQVRLLCERTTTTTTSAAAAAAAAAATITTAGTTTNDNNNTNTTNNHNVTRQEVCLRFPMMGWRGRVYTAW